MDPALADRLATDLQAVPMFADLDPEIRHRLASASSLVDVGAGAWLFREGETGDCLYLLRSGRLEVVLGSSEEAALRVLTQGAVVGELALITDEPRSASVRAVRDSVLVRVDRASFEQLLREVPDFGLAVTRVLARQLRVSRDVTAPPRATASVVAVRAVRPGLVDAELREQLLGALGRYADVCCLDSSRSSGGLAEAGRLLDRHEAEHELVVLFADGEGDADETWNEFCLRQADELLVLVDPSRLPPATERRWRQPCHLAFVGHEPSASQLGPWLDALGPRTHTLVAPGPQLVPDLERLARRLLGRSLGVVLSGGGARGFAHVGVLDVLVQSGLEIDRVGTCSMGAFIGGLFAMGLSPERIHRVCRAEWVERHPLNDFTVPRVALIRARKVGAMLRKVFGERQIEELPRSYFAVSCDLVAASTVVHRRGPVWLAAGASMALPALIPPVRLDDALLVDGGVLNNLPVDLMVADAAGPVVAVSVMSKAIAERGANRLPNIAETVARSMVVGSARLAAENRGLASLVITPEFGDTGMLEFARLDEMVDAGRRAALAALETHGASLAPARTAGASR